MKKLLVIFAFSSIFFSACEDDQAVPVETSGKTTLRFDAVFGTQDFALNTNFVSGSKTYNFTKFRYWISDVSLINSKGEEVKVPESYYLLEETGEINLRGVNNDLATTVYPATKREDVVLDDIVPGDYKTIKFSVGVDQKYNDNLSLQAGELSQLNGMTNVSWMWLTSYIFTSLGGTVSEGGVSKTMKVETGLNTNYKQVLLDLPQPLHISSDKTTTILLNADISKITDGVDIVATPTVGASQAAVMSAVATNYATKVFTVKSVN